MPKPAIKDGSQVDKILVINQHRFEVGLQTLHSVLESLIESSRILNDTIHPDELRENQGMIKAYIKIKKYIESGIDIPQKC